MVPAAKTRPSIQIERIYLVTYRYDLPNLLVCLSSIRHWHPDVEIVIIKNQNCGSFDFSFLQKHYRVSFLSSPGYDYGMYYGSLEPFLSESDERFLYLDTDTALTGPILETLAACPEDFIVDLEETTPEKIAALYWDPVRISHYVRDYTPEWFTFNNGIICGRGGMIDKTDFSDFMDWPQGLEPQMKDDKCFPRLDMSAINVVLNRKSDKKQIRVRREEIMIYPPFYKDSENDLLAGIMNRMGKENRVIHWADQKTLPLAVRPLGKVYQYYFNLFLADLGAMERIRLKCLLACLAAERALRAHSSRVLRALKTPLRRLCSAVNPS